jgi:hypothetical protein
MTNIASQYKVEVEQNNKFIKIPKVLPTVRTGLISNIPSYTAVNLIDELPEEHEQHGNVTVNRHVTDNIRARESLLFVYL